MHLLMPLFMRLPFPLVDYLVDFQHFWRNSLEDLQALSFWFVEHHLDLG